MQWSLLGEHGYSDVESYCTFGVNSNGQTMENGICRYFKRFNIMQWQ